MSNQVFLLPDLGEGLTEADIAEWRVRVGDTVTIDQVVVEVETAKAAVEVPVPFAGVVVELHGVEGDTLRVGTPLITVADDRATTGGSEPDPFETHREEERAGSGNVLIGFGTSHAVVKRRRRVSSAGSPPDVAVAVAPTSQEQSLTPAIVGGDAPSPRVISPIVRNLARQRNINLATLLGTGPGGVIVRADVEGAVAHVAPAVTATALREQRIPLKGLRKAVAEKLSTSRREIPDATTWVDVDATELLAARRAINASLGEDEQVSVMALLARLTVAALTRYPELNAAVDLQREEIVQYGHVNLGIAAQTPRGLVVPVVEGADTLSTVEIAARLRDTVALARAGKLPPARLSGGTFTLNNYGVFGVDGSTPIINHPEAAILGVGRILDRPWVVDGELTIRKIAQISLSFDHRVCDGGAAGGFLRLFGDYVESPVAALGRL